SEKFTMKTTSTLLIFACVLALTAPSASFAMGKSAPNGTGPSSQEIANKAAFLDKAIRDFNAKYVEIKYGPNHTSNWCSYNPDHSNSYSTDVARASNELCNEISGLFQYGLTCSDLVVIRTSDIRWEHQSISGLFDYSCRSVGYGTIKAEMSEKAKQLAQSSFFYDSSNAAVDYNVRAIQSALSHLQLLPRQRKTLDGFFNATDAFVRKIDAEKSKSANGEKALPLTHRSFADQASLLAAYYRYLKDDFAELAQFGSSADGVSKINQQSVDVINASIQHLTDAYGLDSDVAAKQVADYGRVLLDLMSNFSTGLTITEKSVVQPVMYQLVTQVVPAAEAYGDVGAHDAVVGLKTLWESDAFNALLTDKLSVSDEKATALILNMSAAAYKLGLSGNVDIRTFDARDAQRIKNQKGRK
ncbi:MAG: hypothetical protein ACJ763_07355, partial [Bdellovibrionia bacterium]